ncbi:ArsR family transcriptional regulator [Streptomyces sp. gb1(2016)]|uniref:ArsR family transcriptional regulator n=1 Tax=Streptomyces sp. gb1(2016) TaxID=1828321 RepID=A0A652KQ23_9ACTN|nr:ArsR family transcriptional regulator [Streptomyces sp. gb1(2016)]
MEPATADFLKALASETRQKVLQQFTGGIELTVSEVAERCALKPSTASEHLSLLRRGGLRTPRRRDARPLWRTAEAGSGRTAP